MLPFAFSVLLATSFDSSRLSFVPPVSEATSTPQSVWIDKLADCESNGSTTIKILDTNGYYSHGLLMFQMKTWLAYGKPFGATRENIYDGELQRKVAKSMLDDGGQGHWYWCSKRLGDYPL